jgi:hypothetical protein
MPPSMPAGVQFMEWKPQGWVPSKSSLILPSVVISISSGML